MEKETKHGSSRTQMPWLIALVASLALILMGSAALGVISGDRWEYKIVSPSDSMLQSDLDQLGQDGWDLVFARRAVSGASPNTSSSYEMILKRRAKGRTPAVSTLRTIDSSTQSKMETPKTIGYPAPDSPKAKQLLRSCIDGKAHAWKNSKWEVFLVGGTSIACHLEE